MSKHRCKDTLVLIRSLQKQGCKVEGKGERFRLYGKDGITIHNVHINGHGRALHPLRRFAKKEGFQV